ncbi:hypothetical protein AB0M48_01255 [Lentzea sp. NPDC051208]|uniref:hypothetical protein n=1 Tax=Lentzea sp. NPDC051208 TaxID=3154642 RepID=UPI003441428D
MAIYERPATLAPAWWPVGDRVVEVTFWNRPLHATTDAFAAAEFRIFVLQAD